MIVRMLTTYLLIGHATSEAISNAVPRTDTTGKILLIGPVTSEVISNVVPRTDTTGKIMDAHDSKIVFKDGLYHWFAASYGLCSEPANTTNGCATVGVGNCGFATDHNVTLFTSPDLHTWTDAGVVFGATGNLPPSSVLFAPKTVYNAETSSWIMWFNYIVGDFKHSYYGVATSTSAAGPFTLAVAQVNTTRYSDNGDENLFVDTDGSGYMIYTSIEEGHGVSVERMTPDFLGTLGATASSGIIGAGGVEAPAMFKRGEIYYVVFGGCCCYCGSGSPVTVYSATSPLGPYTKRTSLGNLMSQATDIFAYTDASGAEQFMYVGDHWQSAPDGIKGHDFTVWAPIHFDATGTSITTSGFEANFTVSVKTPSTTEVTRTSR